MAKWTLSTPASGGDVADDLEEARVVRVSVDYINNIINGFVVYGKEDAEGNFVPSPLFPPGVEDTRLEGLFEKYNDLQAAWDNFERKLFQRANQDGFIPDGSDS